MPQFPGTSRSITPGISPDTPPVSDPYLVLCTRRNLEKQNRLQRACQKPTGQNSGLVFHSELAHIQVAFPARQSSIWIKPQVSLRSRAVPGKSVQGKAHLCAAIPEKGGERETGQATASPFHCLPAAPLGRGPEPEGLRGCLYQRGEGKQRLAGTSAGNSSLKINEH